MKIFRIPWRMPHPPDHCVNDASPKYLKKTILVFDDADRFDLLYFTDGFEVGKPALTAC
jgi:hypothetical protein